MTVRTFLIGSSAATIISWLIWFMILNWLDPREAGMVGFILFFLALFLAIASTTSLIGYGVRRLIAAGQLPAYRVRHSLRQGMLLGLLIDLLLFLQLLRIVRWWLALLAALIFVLIEFVFLSYDRSSDRYRVA